MIEVEEVWRLIDTRVVAGPAVRRALEDAAGFTLATDARADADAPPSDRATMDGYAVRGGDESAVFRVIGTVAAGAQSDGKLAVGQAWRIFTGAALPEAGLRVIPQEDAERDGEWVRFLRRGAVWNVCDRGEDLRAGETVVGAGTRLGAVELALLATVGETRPLVVAAPRVRHFTTGNEIVPVEATPGVGQIRNSNGALVRALLAEFPIERLAGDHLPDDEAVSRARVRVAEGAAEADVLLFSGGASVGDYDFTAALLRDAGFEIHCAGVNVRPGKPLIFATCGRRIAFGLPGNPVSHFVCFHVFVARALARLTGRVPRELAGMALGGSLPGRPSPRVTFWPARRTPGAAEALVMPVAWNGSGHLASLRGVDALVRVPAEAELPKPGAKVHVLELDG